MYKHFDLDQIYEYFGRDESLIQELVEKFEEEITEGIREIEMSLKDERYENIADISHRIKSSLQYFGAEELYGLTLEIEKIAKLEKDMKQVAVLIKEFNRIYQELRNELAEFKKS